MNDEQLIDILLDSREWQTFDCKRVEIKTSKIIETVCAFANTEGGTIALGLEDPDKSSRDKRLIGISEHEDNASEIINILTKEFEPPLLPVRISEINIINTQGHRDKLILLRVSKSDDIHSLKKGDTFIRTGRQNHKIGAQEITRLRYERGALKYEDESAPNIGLEDLDIELLHQYKKDTSSQEENDWAFLKDNGLAIKSGKDFTLAKSGALLFAKNPTISLKVSVV